MNKKTIAIFAVSMVLVCALSVFTTLALLTSQTDVVTNTFTAGNVSIKLEETEVIDGVPSTGTYVKANEYTFTPNTEMYKDPTITVLAGSEDCYVGALVEFINVPAEALGDLTEAYGITGTNGTMNTSATKVELVAATPSDVTIVEDNAETEGVDETKTAKLYSGKYIIYFADAQAAGDTEKLFDGIKTPDVGNDELAAISVLDGDADAGNDSAIKITGYAVQTYEDDGGALVELKKAFTDLQ